MRNVLCVEFTITVHSVEQYLLVFFCHSFVRSLIIIVALRFFFASRNCFLTLRTLITMRSVLSILMTYICLLWGECGFTKEMRTWIFWILLRSQSGEYLKLGWIHRFVQCHWYVLNYDFGQKWSKQRIP